MSTEPDENGLLIDEYGEVVESADLPDDVWQIRESMEERDNERLHPATNRA